MSAPSLRDLLLRSVTDPYNTKGFRDITLQVRDFSPNTCTALAVQMRELLEDRNLSPVVKLRVLEVSLI